MIKLSDENYKVYENSVILFDGTRIRPKNEFSSFTNNMYHETVTLKFLKTEIDLI